MTKAAGKAKASPKRDITLPYDSVCTAVEHGEKASGLIRTAAVLDSTLPITSDDSAGGVEARTRTRNLKEGLRDAENLAGSVKFRNRDQDLRPKTGRARLIGGMIHLELAVRLWNSCRQTTLFIEKELLAEANRRGRATAEEAGKTLRFLVSKDLGDLSLSSSAHDRSYTIDSTNRFESRMESLDKAEEALRLVKLARKELDLAIRTAVRIIPAGGTASLLRSTQEELEREYPKPMEEAFASAYIS